MRILFFAFVLLFQALGCLQPVQELVQMVMATGYFHSAPTVFICVALAIIAFAFVVKFIPGFAGPFQKFEDWLKAFASGKSGATQASELTNQVQAIAADIAMIKTILLPVQGTAQTATNLDALATGQASPPATGTPQ